MLRRKIKLAERTIWKKQLENQTLTKTDNMSPVTITFSTPTWHQYTNSKLLHQLRRE